MRMVEAEDKKGNRYYDHKLTRIEKGKLLDMLARLNSASTGLSSTSGSGASHRSRPTNSGEIQSAPISGIKDKRLISILQDKDEDNEQNGTQNFSVGREKAMKKRARNNRKETSPKRRTSITTRRKEERQMSLSMRSQWFYLKKQKTSSMSYQRRVFRPILTKKALQIY